MTETADRSADDSNGKVSNKVSNMKARRELMEDGKRYIIYYTFPDGGPEEEKVDV